MKDGELRHVCGGMDVVSIVPLGPSVKPAVEPDLFDGSDDD